MKNYVPIFLCWKWLTKMHKFRADHQQFFDKFCEVRMEGCEYCPNLILWASMWLKMKIWFSLGSDWYKGVGDKRCITMNSFSFSSQIHSWPSFFYFGMNTCVTIQKERFWEEHLTQRKQTKLWKIYLED